MTTTLPEDTMIVTLRVADLREVVRAAVAAALAANRRAAEWDPQAQAALQKAIVEGRLRKLSSQEIEEARARTKVEAAERKGLREAAPELAFEPRRARPTGLFERHGVKGQGL